MLWRLSLSFTLFNISFMPSFCFQLPTLLCFFSYLLLFIFRLLSFHFPFSIFLRSRFYFLLRNLFSLSLLRLLLSLLLFSLFSFHCYCLNYFFLPTRLHFLLLLFFLFLVFFLNFHHHLLPCHFPPPSPLPPPPPLPPAAAARRKLYHIGFDGTWMVVVIVTVATCVVVLKCCWGLVSCLASR